MHIDIKKKEKLNTSMILTSMSEHKESNIVNKELEDSCDNDDNNQPILQKKSPLLISMISNQDPIRYGTAVNLGLIPTEDGASSYVLTSYFKLNECDLNEALG